MDDADKAVKYRGDEPRGFTALSVSSKNGRTDAGEFKIALS